MTILQLYIFSLDIKTGEGRYNRCLLSGCVEHAFSQIVRNGLEPFKQGFDRLYETRRPLLYALVDNDGVAEVHTLDAVRLELDPEGNPSRGNWSRAPVKEYFSRSANYRFEYVLDELGALAEFKAQAEKDGAEIVEIDQAMAFNLLKHYSGLKGESHEMVEQA